LDKLLVFTSSLILTVGIIKFFFGKKDNEEKSENNNPTKEEILEINISGMHCAGCAAGIEGTLKSIDGILDAKVNFATGKGIFRFNPSKVNPQDIISKIQELGYSASADFEEIEKKS